MCRNIRVLSNFEPPATDDEIRAAALQYVRKVSGSTKPSVANQAVFAAAVEDITRITNHLLAELVTPAAKRNRADEARKGQERNERRFGAGRT